MGYRNACDPRAGFAVVSLEAAMSKRRQREREQRLNRTWRNPRYYVLLPVLPIAFVLAAPNILMFAVAKGAQWANDYLDERLTRLRAIAIERPDYVSGDTLEKQRPRKGPLSFGAHMWRFTRQASAVRAQHETALPHRH